MFHVKQLKIFFASKMFHVKHPFYKLPITNYKNVSRETIYSFCTSF